MAGSVEPRVAVVGAGAVGCYFGGMLARAGVPVTFIGRQPHVEAMERNGLHIEGLRVRERVAVRASTDIAAAGGTDLILFCVKTTATSAAARDLSPHLRYGAVVVSLQNGVDSVERIREAAGLDASQAAVYVGAEMSAPGVVHHTARGDLVVAAGCEAIAALFERAQVPCRVSADIRAELWTKMMLNCAMNAISALARTSYGAIVHDAGSRELMRMAIDEGVAVARAEGVALDARALMEAANRLGESAGATFSSTAQDLLRGKPTEIDSLNGYLVRRGVQCGIATPVNQTLHVLVKLAEARADGGGLRTDSGKLST
jgi:2-dehydropantoate 2-reductase